MSATVREAVVLVPGISLAGLELIPLARRLRRAGFEARIFWYLPWQRPLRVSAAALNRTLESVVADRVHLVAHSLGGLVTLCLLQDFPQQRPGRVVILGSPICGCWAAARIASFPGGRWLVGRALAPPHPELSLPGEREVGSIAGRVNVLTGRFLGLPRPNDSLVCVDETDPPGLADHVVLPVSHTGMLFSGRVASGVVQFLHTGRFQGTR